MALFADLEQFFRLGFDAFGNVDNHDGAVHRHQSAVRIFTEVLMARRIKNIDTAAGIIELQYTGRYGNTALFFDFHPVGYSMALSFAGFYRTCQVDSSSVQQ